MSKAYEKYKVRVCSELEMRIRQEFGMLGTQVCNAIRREFLGMKTV